MKIPLQAETLLTYDVWFVKWKQNLKQKTN